MLYIPITDAHGANLGRIEIRNVSGLPADAPTGDYEVRLYKGSLVQGVATVKGHKRHQEDGAFVLVREAFTALWPPNNAPRPLRRHDDANNCSIGL